MITPEAMAEKMKVEILADIQAGIVPRTVKSFSELHDYVDANCYGESEELLDELDAAGPDSDDGHTQALNTLCDVMNPAMEIINQWLADGGANLKPPQLNAAIKIAAIDRLVKADTYRHIIAWGKWLGFTPSAVQESVRLAESENAPADVLQKVDGEWIRVGDIVNEEDRSQVDAIAKGGTRKR
jgi:hypothetical protein